MICTGGFQPHLAEAITEQSPEGYMNAVILLLCPGAAMGHFCIAGPDHSSEEVVAPQWLSLLQVITGIHSCDHSKIWQGYTYGKLIKPTYLHGVRT